VSYEYELQSEGPRHVARYAHRGHPVDVVTGWDVRSDKWLLHIYIDGEKLDGVGGVADTMDEAFQYGIRAAIDHINRNDMHG